MCIIVSMNQYLIGQWWNKGWHTVMHESHAKLNSFKINANRHKGKSQERSLIGRMAQVTQLEGMKIPEIYILLSNCSQHAECWVMASSEVMISMGIFSIYLARIY